MPTLKLARNIGDSTFIHCPDGNVIEIILDYRGRDYGKSLALVFKAPLEYQIVRDTAKRKAIRQRPTTDGGE